MVITTSDDKRIILSPAEFIKKGQRGKWARIPGYDSFSKEIVLNPFAKPYPVLAGQQLRLWYGEDLDDYTESDNGGKVCCDVYAQFQV